MSIRQVLQKLWRFATKTVQVSVYVGRTIRRAWQHRADQNMGDPLFHPRLLRYFWQQAYKFIYLAMASISLCCAVAVAFDNPFETPYDLYFYFGMPKGSPVICISLVLIAGFSLAQFFQLARKDRPEDDQ